MKYRMPLHYVKPFCTVSALLGIFFLVAGSWPAGICMLLGSYLFERNMYRCPHCRQRLEMKLPLFKNSRCPACAGSLND